MPNLLDGIPSDWKFNKHEDWSEWTGNITAYYPKDNPNDIQCIRTICCITKYGIPQEMDAYGKLMAAAPAMYQLLREFNQKGSVPLDRVRKLMESIEESST